MCLIPGVGGGGCLAITNLLQDYKETHVSSRYEYQGMNITTLKISQCDLSIKPASYCQGTKLGLTMDNDDGCPQLHR